jgi:translation initiation factor 2 subunit 2
VADPEVDLFAGMKKKKKKAVALDLDEVPASTDTAVPEPPSPVASKTEEAPAESSEVAPVESDKPAEDGGDLFADMKKKKKKKKEIPLDLVRARHVL